MVDSPTGLSASAVHTSVPKKNPRIRFLVFISSCTPTFTTNGAACADASCVGDWTEKIATNMDSAINKTSHRCRDMFVRLRSTARLASRRPRPPMGRTVLNEIGTPFCHWVPRRSAKPSDVGGEIHVTTTARGRLQDPLSLQDPQV